MKIIMLDGYTANPGDVSFAEIEALGELTVYDRTPPEFITERAAGAEILLTNKTPLTAAAIEALPALRYIGLMSTGSNIADIAAARARGIPITNIPAYSSGAVAQHTFALILELCNHAGLHDRAVRAGEWAASPDFCFVRAPLAELTAKRIGIVGLGKIGRAVAEIARAFGMKVSYAGNRKEHPFAEHMSLDDLLRSSDIVSLHCPLTPDTEKLIDAKRLALMKPSALLINTSRGQVLDEAALYRALADGLIAGAGLDVMAAEPPDADNPLFTLPNCVVTPHIAWAARETRERLIGILAENIRAFLRDEPQNVVN